MTVQLQVNPQTPPEIRPDAIYLQGDFVAGNKITGDVVNANGDFNLTINADDTGNFVKQVNIQQQIVAKPKPRPVKILPRPFRGAIGRQKVVAKLQQTVDQGELVEILGRAGIGKTVVSRLLSHRPIQLPDGIIYLNMHFATSNDVLQYIFDSFYEATKWKPTLPYFKQYLADKVALIVIDGLDLTDAEIMAVADAAPQCSFLFLNKTRALYGEGVSIQLKGLSVEDGTALFIKHVLESISDEDLEKIKRIVMRLEGHPGDILRAAELFERDKVPAGILLQKAHPATFATFAAEQAVGQMGESSEDILELLASFDGISVSPDQIEAITGIQDADPLLDELEARNLISRDSKANRFAIAGSLTDFHAGTHAEWMGKSLSHLARWAEATAENTVLQHESLDALLKAAEWGFENGQSGQAVRVAQQANDLLIHAKRWGYSRKLLSTTVSAAQQTANLTALAWAKHELGTLDLMGKDLAAAQENFETALRIRRQLGERAGAALTEYHLNLLRPIPPIIGKRKLSKTLRRLLLVAVVGSLVGLLAYSDVGSFLNDFLSSTSDPVTVVEPVLTETPTPTAEPNQVPSRTLGDVKADNNQAAETATSTATATSTQTATSTATSSATPTATPTKTATPTVTPTITPEKLLFWADFSEWIPLPKQPGQPQTYQTTITIAAQGGVRPYQYHFGDVTQSNAQYVYSGMPACAKDPEILLGATSKDGQTSKAAVQFFDTPCEPLALNASFDWSVQTQGSSNARVTLSATGGREPYELFANGQRLTQNDYIVGYSLCQAGDVSLAAEVRSADGQVVTQQFSQPAPCPEINFDVNILRGVGPPPNSSGGGGGGIVILPSKYTLTIMNVSGGDGSYTIQVPGFVRESSNVFSLTGNCTYGIPAQVTVFSANISRTKAIDYCPPPANVDG